MSIRRAAVLACAFASPAIAFAQADHTATRVGDIQVGGGVVFGKPDYISPRITGGAFYIDFDKTPNLGGEFEIHQANSNGNDGTYERTYEIGVRYFRTYGRAVPYAKVMVGRGIFNFPGQYNSATNSYGSSVANLAYNMYALGAGTDLKLLPWLHARADYEYQSWSGFQPNGLKPQLITIGLAYHFNGDLRGGR